MRPCPGLGVGWGYRAGRGRVLRSHPPGVAVSPASALLLSLVLSTPVAEAGNGYKNVLLIIGSNDILFKVDDSDATTPVASAVAEVHSDGGEEDVELTESDAWLHGAASLSALPKSDATFTLTVYDSGNAALASFSGTLAADGSVSGVARDDSPDPTRNGTPIDISDSWEASSVDLDLLAAELFPGAKGTYDVTFDLAGADTYEIAYADLVITEGKSTSKAEVGWDAVGSVWTGTLAETHEGLVETKVKTYDGAGKTIASTKAKLGMPLADGGYGAGTLATDEDPLTRVSILSDQIHNGGTEGFLVVSEGWSWGDTLPAEAEVKLDGGDTLTIPVNSYQVVASTAVTFSGTPEKESFEVTIDGVVVKGDRLSTDQGLCSNGTCVALNQGDAGDWSLSATAYAADATKLPTTVKVALASTMKAASVKESSLTLVYGHHVTLVFANEVAVSADPVGIDVTGKVSLLGIANKKGKKETLAKGKFYGTLTRDVDGELPLAGADKDEVQAKGDILIGGEPIEFELTDTNKDGVVAAPAACARDFGKGEGTYLATYCP